MIRGDAVETYPGVLHFLGGNFEPAFDPEAFDDSDAQSPLRRTALREIEEESEDKNSPLPPAKGYVIVGEEHTTGFIQFTYAALYISEPQMNKVKPSPEGSIILVSLSEMEKYVETGILISSDRQDDIRMTPSFALTFLAWLKLGAPNQNGSTPIKREALEAYEKMKNKIRERVATVSH